MINLFLSYLYWRSGIQGIIFDWAMFIIFYLSRCVFKSVSEDVERLSLKITDSALNILLTWGSIIVLSFSAYMASIFYIGLTEMSSLTAFFVAVNVATILLAFWYFERVVICIICYIAAKRKNKAAKFFGKNGFKLIPLRNR